MHVSNNPSATASTSSRLHALDRLSALIEQQGKGEEQHQNSGLQQNDNTPLQVGVVQLETSLVLDVSAASNLVHLEMLVGAM